MSTEVTLTSRRGVLKMVGAGIALGGGIAGEVSASSAVDDDDTFAQQLVTVLSSTQKYQDVETARDHGYEEFGVEPPVGHIFQQSDFFDEEAYTGPTELTEPPALLFYAPVPLEEDPDETDLSLAGVEYHVSGDQTSDPPSLFDDENGSMELLVPEEDGWHRSPTPDVLDVTGLHVWIHLHNPAGMFHAGHPLIEPLIDD